MFDDTLANYTSIEYKIEFLEGVQAYYAKSFTIPKIHEETLKTEVDGSVNIGVLKHVNNSKRAVSTFIIPKKNGTVYFIYNFKDLNKITERELFTIPRIQDLILSLEKNMGYYHIKLFPL